MASYRVTAGYVTVETAVPGGRAQIDIPRGADLPGDVPAEQVDHLLRTGAIEAVEPAPEPVAAPPVGPPPRGGPGSGADAWAAYAHAHGVAVPDGANRDRIQEILVEHNVPVE